MGNWNLCNRWSDFHVYQVCLKNEARRDIVLETTAEASVIFNPKQTPIAKVYHDSCFALVVADILFGPSLLILEP